MKLLLEINVKTHSAISVVGKTRDIVMIPFSAEACGEYFNGRTIGMCVDTQKLDKTGGFSLSARYVLEGVDYDNQRCRVFVENNGDDMEHCSPIIVTDSNALAYWENEKLTANVQGTEDGVIVRIYSMN